MQITKVWTSKYKFDIILNICYGLAMQTLFFKGQEKTFKAGGLGC